jgi:hypothetical protein
MFLGAGVGGFVFVTGIGIDAALQGQEIAAKIDLKINETIFSAWQIPAANLPLGVYRMDILLGGDPAWRSFFRITE